MKRTWRALLTAVLISGGVNGAALVSSARHAEAATDKGRVSLGAVNLVRGSSTGYIEVTIPRDVTISIAEPNKADAAINRDITVRGRGRFVGITLVEDPFPGGRTYNRSFIAGRFGGCDESGCMPTSDAVEAMFELMSPDDFGNRFTLKAGDYRLYLLADGAPVEVSLRLRELTGKTDLQPAVDAVLDMQTSPTHVDAEPAGGRVWSAGSSFDGGQVGFSLSLLEMRADNFAGAEIDICQYNAFEPPPAEAGYGPHCTTLTRALGSSGQLTFDSDMEDETLRVLASFGYHDNKDGTFGAPNMSGQHGLGAWIRSPQDFEVMPLRSLFLTIR